MFKWKQKLLLFSLVTLAVFCLALPVGAAEVRSGDTITIPEGKLHGLLFAAGNRLTIDADVDGDVFAAGSSITINGTVNGDLLAAASSVFIAGRVTGNVRCAGSEIELKGEVGRNLSALGREVRLISRSQVKGDALVLAASADLSGTVDGQALGSGGKISINGPVGGDASFWGVDQLSLGPAAAIGGGLYYGSPNQASIAPGARIAGDTRWEQKPLRQEPTRREGFNWLGQLGWLAAGVLFWGVFTLLFPRLWERLGQVLRQSPGAALGWGLLLLLLTPLVMILFMVTVIGIPVSLLLAAAYLVMLYAAKIIVGDALGRYLAHSFGWASQAPAILLFLIGFLALVILTNIPVVGFFINLAVASLAFGAVALAFYHWRQPPRAAE